MTAFTRKDGLLDQAFDDPSVDALFRSIRREIDLQTEIVERLAKPPHVPPAQKSNEVQPGEPSCKPR